MVDFPPYQYIDFLLGTNNNLDVRPVRGYAVREAGYYDRPQVFPEGNAVALTESPDEATELYCYAVAHSKYPDCIIIDDCWIHSQQRICSAIANRQHWSVR